ncbi:MAG: di-trans,poly-cis-decaprenylcistransferase [Clostridia bacterium]|nr:di-trans,poly-cis-decaprenylcistransferase [Clostridia bacterium]
MFGKKKPVYCDERLRHIAFIMDGNGRWAKGRGMPRSYGHKVGAKAFKEAVKYCSTIGLGHMTVYAFSTENWRRPREEVDAILALLDEYIEEALADLAQNDVRIVFLGEKTPFPDALREKMEHLEAESANNSLILNIAMNYGGRDELLHAANIAIAEGKTTLTEADIDAHLYTKLSPPPDLIVRTANERRLSNFLLWQSAYAELYFTDVLWPDFKPRHIDAAIRDFYARKRNFGGH